MLPLKIRTLNSLADFVQVAETEVKGMGEMLVEVGGGEHCFGPTVQMDSELLEKVAIPSRGSHPQTRG